MNINNLYTDFSDLKIRKQELTLTEEYTDCFSAKGLDPPPANECPDYDTKQIDSEVPVLLELWNAEYPFIAIAPWSTLAPEW